MVKGIKVMIVGWGGGGGVAAGNTVILSLVVNPLALPRGIQIEFHSRASDLFIACVFVKFKSISLITRMISVTYQK